MDVKRLIKSFLKAIVVLAIIIAGVSIIAMVVSSVVVGAMWLFTNALEIVNYINPGAIWVLVYMGIFCILAITYIIYKSDQ